jgi:hypothetical protein
VLGKARVVREAPVGASLSRSDLGFRLLPVRGLFGAVAGAGEAVVVAVEG